MTSSKLFESWPQAIVRVSSEEDIVAALACARYANVSVTARSGGHSNAGASSISGAVMIDVKGMNAVQVSDDWDTVVIGAGSTAGQAVYKVLLATNGTRNLPVGQKPTVGMAGLTLGGGWGFFSRYQGLLCDQVINLTMVLPDGKIITASKNENPDIFWASCGGGGGNVGIVTEFTMKTMKVPEVSTRIDFAANYTVDAVDFYQQISTKLSDKVTLNLEVTNGDIDSLYSSDISLGRRDSAGLRPLPPGKLYIQLVGIYLGTAKELYKELENAGMSDKTPINLDMFKKYGTAEMPVWQAQLDLMGWPNSGKKDDLIAAYLDQNTYYRYKSMFLFEKLPRAAIEILLESGTWQTDNSSLVWEFQSLGGTSENSAVARVSSTATAFTHRNAQYGLLLKSNAREAGIGASLNGRLYQAWASILPYVKGNAAYVNMIDFDLGNDGIQAYYGAYPPTASNGEGNIERLQSIVASVNSDRLLTTIQPI